MSWIQCANGLEFCSLTGLVRSIDITESNKAMDELIERYKRANKDTV